MHPAFNIQDVKGSVFVALKGVREMETRFKVVGGGALSVTLVA